MTVVQLLPALNEGGVERGTVEMNRELVKRGIKSAVISCGGKLSVRIEEEGGRHIRLDVCSKNPLSLFGRVHALQKTLRKLQPDILHVRSRVPGWLVRFANMRLHIPVVSTVHGFHSVNAYSRIVTRADKIICVSGAIRDYVLENYGVTIDKTVVIPRGIDTNLFCPDCVDTDFIEEFKARYDLDTKVIVSVVGRITQLKDLETFIAAIERLKKRVPNICGVIVGGVHKDKQAYYATLLDLVKKRKLQDHIVFVGSQSRVAEIYALSDVVVSSSKKPESFGRSVAEAIAMNTPVVATAHGGVLDIIKESEHGYFYTPGDAQALADAIMKAKTLRFDGYEYIRKNFSLEKMVERTIEVYKKVTA